jgi:hypothetical protein
MAVVEEGALSPLRLTGSSRAASLIQNSASFFPLESPNLVCCVHIENPTEVNSQFI